MTLAAASCPHARPSQETPDRRLGGGTPQAGAINRGKSGLKSFNARLKEPNHVSRACHTFINFQLALTPRNVEVETVAVLDSSEHLFVSFAKSIPDPKKFVRPSAPSPNGRHDDDTARDCLICFNRQLRITTSVTLLAEDHKSAEVTAILAKSSGRCIIPTLLPMPVLAPQAQQISPVE